MRGRHWVLFIDIGFWKVKLGKVVGGSGTMARQKWLRKGSTSSVKGSTK